LKTERAKDKKINVKQSSYEPIIKHKIHEYWLENKHSINYIHQNNAYEKYCASFEVGTKPNFNFDLDLRSCNHLLRHME
jgi:hypothetical protein